MKQLRSKTARQGQGAYTLMEMMVVAAVLGLVMAYMMETLTYQQRAYVVTEQVTEAQQNLRLISDLMEREIRVAGYMVPPAAAACAVDQLTGPDKLLLSAADRIRTVEQLEAVDLSLVQGNLGAPVTAPSGIFLSNSTVNINFSRGYADVAADGMDYSQGSGVIIVDLNDTTAPVACGEITDWPGTCTTAGGCTAQVAFELSTMPQTNAAQDLLAVPAHIYEITGNQLRRNGDLMARDVEDLQLVFYYDDDGDRVVDGNELYGVTGSNLPAPASIDYTQLVEIRMNLITRTRDDDPNDKFIGTQGQVTANRTTVAPADRRRRRVHSSTVRLRNLG